MILLRLLLFMQFIIDYGPSQISLDKIRIQMNTFRKIIISTIPVPNFHFQQTSVEINQYVVRIHLHHFVQIPNGSVGFCPQHGPVVISINIIAVDPDHLIIIGKNLRIAFHLIPDHRPTHQNSGILGISLQRPIEILDCIVIILVLVPKIPPQSKSIVRKHV